MFLLRAFVVTLLQVCGYIGASGCTLEDAEANRVREWLKERGERGENRHSVLVPFNGCGQAGTATFGSVVQEDV